MRRLLIVLLMLTSLQTIGQTVTGDRVVARQGFYLRDWWVDSVRRDTSGWQFSPRTLPTSKAIYDFVLGRSTANGYGLLLSSNTFRVDTFNVATRGRLYKALDSLKATIPAQHFANTDLTATGNRAHDFGSYTLQINNTGTFMASAVSGDITTSVAALPGSAGVVAQDFGRTGEPLHRLLTYPDSIVLTSQYGAGQYLDLRLRNLPSSTTSATTKMLAYDTVSRKVTYTDVPAGGTSLSDGDKGDITVSGSGATWTIDKPTLTTLTDGATVTWDYATQGILAKVTIAGNRALSITNLPAGKAVWLSLWVIQDATGSRTLSLPAGTKVINGGAGAVTLTTTGGAWDKLTFEWDGTTLSCNYGKNYN